MRFTPSQKRPPKSRPNKIESQIVATYLGLFFFLSPFLYFHHYSFGIFIFLKINIKTLNPIKRSKSKPSVNPADRMWVLFALDRSNSDP